MEPSHEGLRAELEALRDVDGGLTADRVVDAASDPAHPLHHRFEWDDGVAGHAHRLAQARGLIRSVRVVYREPDTGERRSVRAYVSTDVGAGRAYRPTDEVLADPLAGKIMLADMEREWRTFRRRWQHMDGFRELVLGGFDEQQAG